MPVLGDPAAYELAHRAGLDAVDEQSATLRETRDRAGALLSAAAVAAGLVAGLAFSTGRAIGWIGALGGSLSVVGFVGVVTTTVLIWRPTAGRFVHNAGVIVGSYVEGDPPLDLPEVHRELALWLGDQAETNREAIEVRLETFTWGLGFLLVEVAGAVIALGGAVSG